MSDNRTHLIKQAHSRSDDYKRGVADGRELALEEIRPEVEKIAGAAIQTMRQEDLDREVLRGQVTAQSAANHLGRFKASMKLGLCWKCGKNSPADDSAYMLCNSCSH